MNSVYSGLHNGSSNILKTAVENKAIENVAIKIINDVQDILVYNINNMKYVLVYAGGELFINKGWSDIARHFM